MKNTKNELLENKIDALKNLLPEVFENGLVNIKLLENLLDKYKLDEEEFYSFNWRGKNEAKRLAYQSTTLTLRPNKDKSKDFNNSKNIYIEGENLNVLRILRDSYAEKVKFIYIDPPYNLDGERVYPDRYTDDLNVYKRFIGTVDSDGKTLSTDQQEVEGRKHTNWLNLMYSRLLVARDFLKDDGVICISIDDNEVADLKKICNEIFGEVNFEGHIHWRRRTNQPNDRTKMIGLVAEHILVYAKNSKKLKESGVGKVDITGKFTNPDNDPRGEWASKPWKVGSNQSGSKYEIKLPSGKLVEEQWMGDKNSYKRLLEDNRIYFPKKGKGNPRKKYYKFERLEEGQSATNWWEHEKFGSNQGASKHLESLLGSKNLFDNPKPVELIRGLIQIANVKDGDIVLDFFSGSSTTAEAVMRLNAEERTKRKFIMVQIPEPISEKEEAFKLGYRRITEIGRDRLIAASKKIESEFPEISGWLDLGFKTFELSESNFPQWDENVTLDLIDDQMSAIETKITNIDNSVYEIILLLKEYLLDVEINEINKNLFVLGNEIKTLLYLGDSISNEIYQFIIYNSEKYEKILINDNALNQSEKLNLVSLLDNKIETI